MTACSWCGAEIPRRRPGRRGRYLFCAAAHRRNWQRAAREIGAAAMKATGLPGQDAARNWNANYSAASGGRGVG